MIEEGIKQEEPTRRDFIHITAGAVAGVGAGALIWTFIDQMNPASDTLALASIEVNIGDIEEGEQLTVKWRGRPVFIRHRTEKEIAEARAVPLSVLKDPQTDEERLIKDIKAQYKPQYLVMEGNCTHLGCVPIGQSGDYGGWFCPCHGSHYDTAGRIRRGPAPSNLYIPPYKYISNTVIKIG